MNKILFNYILGIIVTANMLFFPVQAEEVPVSDAQTAVENLHNEERSDDPGEESAIGNDSAAASENEMNDEGGSSDETENEAGTGDVTEEEETAEEDDRIKVAVIGKPNVGKSSLINQILGEKRVIVSDVAGTTRDAVDSEFENQYGKYLLIDTAGIRRKSKVEERVERFSVMRAQLAIERADVCLIMIDARDGVTDQDTKIAGLAHEAGKASIVIVNKWDLVEKETGTMEKMRKDIMRDLSFMSYAPILFISALTGQRTERIFELINFANDQTNMRITTGMLNDVLTDAQMRVQPPTDKGRRLKIYYMTQTGVRPPSFVVFCNRRDLFHFSYQRYLENQIRAVFGLEGTPIRMVIRQKGDTE